MPIELENKLKAQVKQKGLTGEHANAYIYGVLRRTGWKPEREKKNSMQKQADPIMKGLPSLADPDGSSMFENKFKVPAAAPVEPTMLDRIRTFGQANQGPLLAGGIGAGLGGIIGATAKKNKVRNSILTGLLGGGLAAGGSYLYNKYGNNMGGQGK